MTKFIINFFVAVVFGGIVGGVIGVGLYFFSSNCSCYYFCNPKHAVVSGAVIAAVYFLIRGKPVIKLKG